MILLTDDQIDLIAERIAAKLKREEKRTYTLQEAADVLSISRNTAKRLLYSGVIKRLPGTAKPIIPATEIDKLLSHGLTR